MELSGTPGSLASVISLEQFDITGAVVIYAPRTHRPGEGLQNLPNVTSLARVCGP